MPNTVIAICLAAGVCAVVLVAVGVRQRRRREARLHSRAEAHERLAEELRERTRAYRGLADEQASLRRVAMAVAGQAGSTEVLDLVAEEAARLIGAEMGQVCRFTGRRALVVGAWGNGALVRNSWFSLFGSKLMADVSEGNAARVDDYGALAGHDPEGHEKIHPSQFGAIAAPIWVESELWGAILAVSAEPVDRLPAGSEARLERFAELVTLAVAAADERDRLRDLATTDALTGVRNRRAFDSRLAGEVERCTRHKHALSLVLIDIDHFKAVNDTHGHQVGDDVLVEVARRLESQARGSDIVARIGGEEFAWLLPETTALGAADAADRARALISSTPIGAAGRITASAGVTDVAAAGSDAQELVRLADEALYSAKHAGRDRTVVAAIQEALPGIATS